MTIKKYKIKLKKEKISSFKNFINWNKNKIYEIENIWNTNILMKK